MTAPNRRVYPVSSAVLEELLTDAEITVDEISARIGNGEKVSTPEALATYEKAFNALRSGIYAAISDVVAEEIRKTIDTQRDLDAVATEFPL